MSFPVVHVYVDRIAENAKRMTALCAAHGIRAGVVTDRFHQFRSGRIARTARMDSFPVSCGTAWYFSVQFWMRDMLCITERLIRGHW